MRQRLVNLCVWEIGKSSCSLSLFKSNCCDLFLCVDDIIRCLYILWAGAGLEKSEPYQSIARACTFQNVLRPSTKDIESLLQRILRNAMMMMKKRYILKAMSLKENFHPLELSFSLLAYLFFALFYPLSSLESLR